MIPVEDSHYTNEIGEEDASEVSDLAEPYYEARADYADNSETLLLRNGCACNWKPFSRKFLCVTGVHRKFLVEKPELHKILPAREPCVTDVLCN